MSKKLTLVLALICTLVLGWTASAQSYVRYVKPEDFGTKTLYADSVLTTITLPRGVSKLSNYYKFNVAAFELSRFLRIRILISCRFGCAVVHLLTVCGQIM